MDKTNQTIKKESSTAALTLGIIGLVLAFIPFVNYISGIFALIGLILAIIGVTKKKAKSVAALVISLIAGIMAIVMIFTYTGMFFSSVSDSIKKTEKENNTPVSVVYEVDGTSTDSTITYSTYSNGTSGSEQASNQSLPFTKTVTGTKGWSGYTLTGSNGNENTSISCKITVDGKVVSQQTSTGAYSTVTCSSSTGDASSSK